MAETVKNKGWTVTWAAVGINLALGILYAWSIFKAAIETSIKTGGEGAFTWNTANLNDPYSLCCLVFAFSMILAGKCQDKFGPRITAFIGGLLVGAGLLWISQTTSYWAWVLGFGLLAGTGMGFGYSAATPPGLKWFPASKTGLIAGLIVAGFGLAPVYIAPLSGYLIKIYGVNQAMLVYGIAFIVVVCGLSMFLVNPPEGYVPVETKAAKAGKKAYSTDVPWNEILKTMAFWKMWVIYFVGAGAGLMVISSVAGIAKHSMGDMAFVAVAIMAIGNAGGRIITGVMSDKFGRNQTILAVHLFQAALMLACIPLVGGENHTGAVVIVLLATFIGFNYGANLALFPSIAKDLWGFKGYGVNYGILFTAWGVGGFVLSRVSQMMNALTGSMNSSFIVAAILLTISSMITVTLITAKSPKDKAPEGAIYQPGLGLTMADGGEKMKEDGDRPSA